jgi:hypothetical protein
MKGLAPSLFDAFKGALSASLRDADVRLGETDLREGKVIAKRFDKLGREDFASA